MAGSLLCAGGLNPSSQIGNPKLRFHNPGSGGSEHPLHQPHPRRVQRSGDLLNQAVPKPSAIRSTEFIVNRTPVQAFKSHPLRPPQWNQAYSRTINTVPHWFSDSLWSVAPMRTRIRRMLKQKSWMGSFRSKVSTEVSIIPWMESHSAGLAG